MIFKLIMTFTDWLVTLTVGVSHIREVKKPQQTLPKN